MILSAAVIGYVLTVFCLFKMDTRSERAGDWVWGGGMLGGILMMILGVLLWAVPDFFKG